jgi:hypothetical protein
MIVGGVLVAAGEDLDAALQAIEESRGVEVPETEEQRRWLGDFASWVVSRPYTWGNACEGWHFE